MPKQKGKKKFREADFIRSVWKTMEKQAKNNPAVSRLHERLSPEYEKVMKLIQTLLLEETKIEEKVIDEIFTFREKAILPLVDFIKKLKEHPPVETTDAKSKPKDKKL